MVRQRPNGLWEGRITVAGKRRSVYGHTEADVEDQLDGLRAQAKRGIGTDMSVGDYLEWWLADVAKGTVKPSTLDGYTRAVDNHLAPAQADGGIGDVRLDRLTAAHVHQMMQAVKRKGLSPRTVQYVHAVLRSALDSAWRFRLVGENVALLARPPQVSNDSGNPLSPAEAPKLVAAATGDRLEALWLVALACGLRQGQALALDRDTDVDLAAGALNVTHTIGRIGGRWVRVPIGANKGGAGTVPLPALAADSLRAHLERQDMEKAWAGELWRPAEVVDADGNPTAFRPVFCREDGQPLHSRSLLARFHRLCDAAGIERRRFHDLRHSTGSLLVASGVPQRVVMQMLRHSTMAMSARYTRQVDEVLREASDQLGDLLGRTTGRTTDDPSDGSG